MNKVEYDEMIDNISVVAKEFELNNYSIFLFGHSNASLVLADVLLERGYAVSNILDNSELKQGLTHKGISVCRPNEMINEEKNSVKPSIVFIVSRFYAVMHKQLRDLGYEGVIRKLIDYNTFAEYSLSEDTQLRMNTRLSQGAVFLNSLRREYADSFRVFFPFNALGDVYIAMSYWKIFSKTRNIDKVVFCVASKAVSCVINLFGNYQVQLYEQKDLDSLIQASLYNNDDSSFIAHHDRPYVINLHRALYIKRIPFEQIYCCGVYGLPKDTVPTKPSKNQRIYKDIESIPVGKSVIFSPYAKSVTALDPKVWEDAVNYYSGIGYKCFTNVVGDEKPLPGTEAISPSILEMSSVVERAGTFIGIRSGLCDVIREANAKKIALYPDYNYCDTKWKAIEIYWISQFDHNLLATEEIRWETL